MFEEQEFIDEGDGRDECSCRGETYITGYTDNYIKVYVPGGRENLNSFKEVKLLEIYKDGMKGEI